MLFFKLHRRDITQSRMASMGVIPSFDKGENGHAGFGFGAKRPPINQLAFECGKETFAQSVVITIPRRSHRGTDLGFSAAFAKGNRCVLRSLVGMVNYLLWFPLANGAIIRSELGSGNTWQRRVLSWSSIQLAFGGIGSL